jgi:type IV pilus assembly protein PilA
MKRYLQQGFTLVELMIVVAIIGILAALAIPAYADYTKRTMLSEVVMAASACRVAISEMYQQKAAFPTPGTWGCEQAGGVSRYVVSVATDAGAGLVITARGTGDASIDNHTVSLVPVDSAGLGITPSSDIFKWVCGNTVAVNGQAGTITTVPAKFLPSSCRGD